jgi:hypothetical protein
MSHLLQAPSASAKPSSNNSRRPVDAIVGAALDADPGMVALARLRATLTWPAAR